MQTRSTVRPLAAALATMLVAAASGVSYAHPVHRSAPTAKARAAADTTGQSTLEQRLIGGDPADGFAFLRLGPGEGHLLREELGRALPGRENRRRSLVYVAQLSDFQLSDEESPARVEFFDRDPSGFATSAWRPQEALVAHQSEYTMRQVNRFLDSPVRQGDGSRARMLNAVMTGDLADNMQHNETEWVVKLLEGGTIDPSSGTTDVDHQLCPPGVERRDADDPRKYTGVQDYDDYPGGPASGDPIFYDPDDVRGVYADRNWPLYRNLMDKAQEPFEAQGLRVPSYVAYGNHDGLVQGNAWANKLYEDIARGCVKPLTSLVDPQNPLGTPFVTQPADILADLAANPQRFMVVPRDERRRFVDPRQFKALHDTGKQADEHGFAFVDREELEASNGAAAYYSFAPKPGIRYIVLDTVSNGGTIADSSNGNIDDPQFQWLERELSAAQRRNELILVFAHHATGSLTSNTPDEAAPPCTSDERDPNAGCDRDPRPSIPVHQGPDLEALLHRFPNVVMLAAGHSHENRVQPFRSEQGGDFWEIKSPAIVDWPTQHRLIEVMDNRDGTLSIFATMLDHDGPATGPAGGEDVDADAFSLEQLVSLGRTLAYNDPQVGPGMPEGGENPSGEPQGEEGPEGVHRDRNVELILRDPRARPAAARPAPTSEAAPDGPDDEDRDRRGAQPEREPTAAATGDLPFTGLPLLPLLVLGLLLGSCGLLARRRLREPG